MRIINSIALSLIITGLFVAGALLKGNSTKLDLYLGAIWVLILSLIIVFSFSHVLTKGHDGKNIHHH